MIDKNLLLSNGGLVIKDATLLNNSPFLTSPQRINLGFISSAVASMINDKPKIDQVTEDVKNLQILSEDSLRSYKLTLFILDKSIKLNLAILREFFSKKNLNFDSYSVTPKDLKVSNLSKCGALVIDGSIKQVRLMGINDAHILQFDRDFIGYFLFFSFSGKILFFYKKKLLDIKINYSFSKIPLLSFKSENAFKNQQNRDITYDILINLTNKNILGYYL